MLLIGLLALLCLVSFPHLKTVGCLYKLLLESGLSPPRIKRYTFGKSFLRFTLKDANLWPKSDNSYSHHILQVIINKLMEA